MGKGGFFGIVDETVQCFHCITTALCTAILAGPILTIVGICFLVSSKHDSRGDRIKIWTTDLGAWSTDPVYGYSNYKNAQIYTRVSYGACSSTSVTQSTAYLQGTGAADDVMSDKPNGSGYSQWKLSSALGVSSSSSSCSVQVDYFNVDSTTSTPTVDLTSTVSSMSAALFRTSTYSKSDLSCVCTKSSCRSTETSKCQSACSSRGGTYSTSSGTCSVNQRLSKVCIRVSPKSASQPKSYMENTTYPTGLSGGGCFYYGGNFAYTLYETASVSVPQQWTIVTQARAAEDPYLTYLVETEGGGSFGLTVAQKRNIGLSCLLIGIAFFAFWIFVCVCCYNMIAKRPQAPPQGPMQNYFYHASGRYGGYIGYPVAQPTQPGQPMFVTPQPPPMEQGKPNTYAQGYPIMAQGTSGYPPPPQQYYAPQGPQYPSEPNSYPPPAGQYSTAYQQPAQNGAMYPTQQQPTYNGGMYPPAGQYPPPPAQSPYNV